MLQFPGIWEWGIKSLAGFDGRLRDAPQKERSIGRSQDVARGVPFGPSPEGCEYRGLSDIWRLEVFSA